ncbi:unnamed protein product [Closterium sp. NIES-54]
MPSPTPGPVPCLVLLQLLLQPGTVTTATATAATASPTAILRAAQLWLRFGFSHLIMRADQAATAPPATADSSTRSQWLTRDAAAHLAIRKHLPLTVCAHFGQHRTAQALYDAVVARYSSPATAALGHLLLPYLFPEQFAFTTVKDLVSHLHASDARYRVAVPAEDHFLSLDPTSLTVDLLEQHLLAAETSAVAVGAARGTPRPPFFEGCSPSPLAPSYASAAAADVSDAEDVRATSASAKHRSSKGKGGRGGGGGSGGGGGGSGSGGGGSSEGGGGGMTVGGSGGSGGGGGGSGGSGGGGGGGTGSGGTGARRVGSGGGQRQQQQRRSETPSPQQLHLRAAPHLAPLLLPPRRHLACAEGDCYRCVPPDPGILAAALGASASGTLPGSAPAQALHTFNLDSGALRYFFRDSTTLTPLPAPIPIRLADPSGGLVVARSSTVLPCPADAMVTTTTPGGQRVSICTCTRTGRHLAMFTRRPGSSLYTLTTEPSQVAASAQVSASGQVAASCPCRLLSHQTLLWHHRLGHPSLPRLRCMHSRLLVSGLPRSLPPLPPSPAPPCLPCVEGWQRTAPHSSSFPPTTAPLQTLHMDVWGPARVSGQSRERYFLLVVDDYTRYTTVFPLRSKGQVVDVLIHWIRAVRLQLRERFGQDLPVLRLHSERGGEFSSTLLRDICCGEGILCQRVCLGGLWAHSDPLLNKPFYPNGLVVGILTCYQSEGLGFESQFVHLGHPSAGGCQRSIRDPRLILGKGYRHVVLGGYGRTDLLLKKPFYPSGLVTGILTRCQRGLRRVCLGGLWAHSDPLLNKPFYPNVMEVARTSMIHAASPHFLWPFAVRNAAHQLNLWPRVSLPETSPTLRWTGEVGDASVFRVWGSHAFVRDTSANKLSPRAIPCVLLGFVPHAPGWQFYHPTSRRVFPSQDVTFDESVPFYHLFPYRSAPPPPSPLFLAPGPPQVDPLPPHGPAPSGVSQVDPLPGPVPVQVAGDSGAALCAASGGTTSGGAEPGSAESEGAETGGAGPGGVATWGGEPGGAEPESVEPGGAASEGAESGGAGPQGAASSGGSAGALPRLSPQQLREWFVWRTRLRSGVAGGGGPRVASGAGVLGGTATAGPGGARTRGAGARDLPKSGTTGTGDAGVRGAGVGGPGAGGAGAGGPGVLGTPSFADLPPPLLCPSLDRSLTSLQPGSPLPAPSPYTEQSGGLTERREPVSRPVLPVRTARRVPRSRPHPVPRTHAMTLHPSSVPLRVPLPAPPESSLPEVPDPESDRARSASPTVSRLIPSAVTDPSFESAAASALVAELLDFAAACRLDYATALVAESASANPPSVGGDYELHSLDFSTAFLRGSLHEEIWLCRPPGFTESFPAGTQWSLRRPVHGLRQAPCEWHDTLRTTLAALGFAPATADPSLFLRTDISLPPFYVLVYVDNLVFATADTKALTLVKSELQKKHTCTDLGELQSYLGLQITGDRAQHTITLTQSHMVHQVLQRFGFQFSSPQPTPLSTSHSLSAPPSDESIEPSGPYPELVGCLMYLMTCTRPDLAYPLSLLARYMAPGRHRKVHWDAAKRVLHYLCSTSGMGLVLGGWGPVVLTGHADASWELRWLTYMLTDLGEQPRSPPVLYVDNKAMIALC